MLIERSYSALIVYNAIKKGMSCFTKKYETTFIKDGFSNWKKAYECFNHHESSECHREAQLKIRSMKAPCIATQLSSQVNSTQARNKKMLLKQLSSLRFLLREGLAIRGHNEQEGNLYWVLKQM